MKEMLFSVCMGKNARVRYFEPSEQLQEEYNERVIRIIYSALVRDYEHRMKRVRSCVVCVRM
jgi:hypothetical protein